MIEYVAGFMFDPSKTMVALIEKQKPEWQKGLYNGIGGKIERPETIHHAMSREFKEETGLYIAPVNWEHKVHLYREGVYSVYFFSTVSERWNEVESKEEEKVYTFNVNSLPQTIPNLKWLIPLCLEDTIKFPIIIQDIRGN